MNDTAAITALDISESLKGRIQQAGYKTVGELRASMSAGTAVERIPRCGPHCIREIEKAIAAFDEQQSATGGRAADDHLENRFFVLGCAVTGISFLLLVFLIVADVTAESVVPTCFARQGLNFLTPFCAGFWAWFVSGNIHLERVVEVAGVPVGPKARLTVNATSGFAVLLLILFIQPFGDCQDGPTTVFQLIDAATGTNTPPYDGQVIDRPFKLTFTSKDSEKSVVKSTGTTLATWPQALASLNVTAVTGIGSSPGDSISGEPSLDGYRLSDASPQITRTSNNRTIVKVLMERRLSGFAGTFGVSIRPNDPLEQAGLPLPGPCDLAQRVAEGFDAGVIVNNNGVLQPSGVTLVVRNATDEYLDVGIFHYEIFPEVDLSACDLDSPVASLQLPSAPDEWRYIGLVAPQGDTEHRDELCFSKFGWMPGWFFFCVSQNGRPSRVVAQGYMYRTHRAMLTLRHGGDDVITGNFSRENVPECSQ